MTSVRSVLLCVLAMLPACISPPAEPCLQDTLFVYHALPAQDVARLKQALRLCASLEMQEEHGCTQPSTRWRCVLHRGRALDAVLARLAAVPEWYEQRELEGPPIDFICTSTVRFRDTKGRLLLEFSRFCFAPCYREADGSMTSLLCLLPIPEHM